MISRNSYVYEKAVKRAVCAVKNERARSDWSKHTDRSRDVACAAAKHVFIFADVYDYEGAMAAAEDALAITSVTP